MTSVLEIIGQRALLKVSGRMGSHDVREYRMLELSPSGNWARLQDTDGRKFWKAVADISLVEVLRDLKAERPTDEGGGALMNQAHATRLAFGVGLVLAALLASSVVAWDLSDYALPGPVLGGWFHSPLSAWWWWQAWGHDAEFRNAFTKSLILLPIIAIMPPVLLRFYEMNSPLRRTKPDPVAGFGTVRDLLRTGISKRGDGVVIGNGGWRTILRDNGDAAVLIAGPSRGGKGAGHVIPTLLSHSGSMLVFDPKHELSAITGRRRRAYGDVLVFDPTDRRTSRFNPLLEIRTGDHLIGDCQMAARILTHKGGAKSDDPFWDNAARQLLVALLSHVRMSSDPTLAHLFQLALKIKEERYPTTSDPYVRSVLAGHKKLEGRVRGSIDETLIVHLSFLADPLIQSATAVSDFRAGDLQAGPHPLTLFVSIPVADGERLRPLTRLVLETIGAAMTVDINMLADGRKKVRPVLALLDEFTQLGRLDLIGEKIKIMSSYKIRCCLVCQSEEDIVGAYGQHQTITDNCATICAIPGFGVPSLQALARRGGRHQVTQSSKQIGGGFKTSSNMGQSESHRDLLDAGEMLIRSRREVLVFKHGCHPTWLKKVRYWREAEYRGGFDAHVAMAAPEPAAPLPTLAAVVEPEVEDDEPLTAQEAEGLDDLEDLVCALPEHVAKRFKERLNMGNQA